MAILNEHFNQPHKTSLKKELPLFKDLPPLSAATKKDYGTFKDSMRAPIYRWFQYPAGYSYKFIQEKIKEYKLNDAHWIFDPFVGSGTTVIAAKEADVNSIGIEAHPFVYEIARIKTFWEYDLEHLSKLMTEVSGLIDKRASNGYKEKVNIDSLPELVRKCYSPENLKKLLTIRETILEAKEDDEYKDFLKIVLTNTLRTASKAGTGWPYIAPSKYHEKVDEKDGINEFKKNLHAFYKDVLFMRTKHHKKNVKSKLIFGDARLRHKDIARGSVDLAVTSPPYLNNYDYADRTRLETYFWGKYSSWGDITKEVRDKLMIAATTQIRRSDFGDSPLGGKIKATSPLIYDELSEKIKKLCQMRMKKGGRKSYDLMVAGYFNDIYEVIKQVHRVLKSGRDFVMVLGDSAPYGVHIPTDIYLGEIAKGLGFKSYAIEELRRRGEKWAHNSQRHSVPLKEVLLTIKR